MSNFRRDRLPGQPTMYLTVAPPRCGKSSWANRMKARLQAAIVSRDDIRRTLGVDRFDPRLEPMVTMVEEYMIRSLLIRGQNVIVDNINHTKWIRNIYWQIAQETEARVVAVIFPAPTEAEWRRRCEETEFPWEVVEGLAREAEPLSEYEARVMGRWSDDYVPEEGDA